MPKITNKKKEDTRMKKSKINLSTKYLLGTLCSTFLLGFASCSGDYVQTDVVEKVRPAEVPVVAYDTTYLNLGVDEIGFKNEDTKEAAAAMMQVNAPQTRSLQLDGNGQPKENQEFKAICFIRNKTTHQLGRFELDWTLIKQDDQLIMDGQRDRSVAIVWQKGTAPANLSGDDWEVSAIAGGGKAMQKDGHEVVSFDLADLNVSGEGQVAVPFISEYTPAKSFTEAGVQRSLIKLRFKLAGTLLKLKVKRDDDVSLDEDFVFRTTGIIPSGVFSMQSFTGDNAPVDKAEWKPSMTDGTMYELRLKGSNAAKLTEAGNKYFVWYVWGMPNKTSANIETTMVTMDGGYIIKHGNHQGPMVNTYNFTNDEGKMKTFNLSMHAPEPYPGFNFLNIMERVAEYNLDGAKHWWTSNRIPEYREISKKYKTDPSVMFSQSTAADPAFMPDGYHLPSLDEMTVLLPFTAVEEARGNDLNWNTAFTNKSSAWKEKVTLYAHQDTYESGGKNVWVVCDDPAIKSRIATAEPKKQQILNSFDRRNVKLFKSYIWLPDLSKKIIYSIRFAENTDVADNNVYGNKIRCAYKWDFTKLTKNAFNIDRDKQAYAIVTCRWIGDSPVTIDDITNEAWWNHNSKYNVVRELPAAGVYEQGGYRSVGQASQFITSGIYDNKLIVRRFNVDWGGSNYGSFQRKWWETDFGHIRPFKNTMMRND